MNVEKYDKLVWRINGYAILAGIGIGFFVLLFLAYRIAADVMDTPKERKADITTQQESRNDVTPAILTLGRVKSLKGTDYLLIPLQELKSGGLNSSYDFEYNPQQIKNLLLFHHADSSSRWFFEDNSNVIFEDLTIFDLPEADNKSKATGIAVTFAAKDTDLDEKINQRDLQSVLYFDLATGRKINIVEDADRIIGVQPVKNNKVLFIYSTKGKSYLKSLNSSTLELETEKEIGRM